MLISLQIHEGKSKKSILQSNSTADTGAETQQEFAIDTQQDTQAAVAKFDDIDINSDECTVSVVLHLPGGRISRVVKLLVHLMHIYIAPHCHQPSYCNIVIDVNLFLTQFNLAVRSTIPSDPEVLGRLKQSHTGDHLILGCSIKDYYLMLVCVH